MASDRYDNDDTAGVIAPPPLIYLAWLVVGLALNVLWPAGLGVDGGRYAVGAVLFALGGAVAAFSIRQLRNAGTNFETHKPTTAVVTGGPYRFSRNPIYVALTLAYAGIAVAVDSLWVLALLVPAVVVMRYGVIAREERYLERRFGAEYRRYRATVRRWL